MSIPPSLLTLPPARFDTPAILKKLAMASRNLAELKGIAESIPYQGILINTLGMQEAKDSSAIENIVTTHDELFKYDAYPETAGSAAAKEVLRYRQALRVGFDLVRTTGLITNNGILAIQAELERNSAGFRKLPGTTLKEGAGRTIYTLPQDPSAILRLMGDLEIFINDDTAFAADPLIKMALMHYQFETIHPFYDGNGRTGRILNVLYLVKQGLLDIPILYSSRHIVRTKADYYRLLQAVRERDAWEDLINNLFTHPYTRIDHLQRELGVSRLTATKYLDALAATGFVRKHKVGRNSYYINVALNAILTGETMLNDE
jgi:Fic family protein